MFLWLSSIRLCKPQSQLELKSAYNKLCHKAQQLQSTTPSRCGSNLGSTAVDTVVDTMARYTILWWQVLSRMESTYRNVSDSMPPTGVHLTTHG